MWQRELKERKTLPGIPFLPLIASQYMWQRELKVITNNHFVKEVTSQYMWQRELKGYGMGSWKNQDSVTVHVTAWVEMLNQEKPEMVDMSQYMW